MAISAKERQANYKKRHEVAWSLQKYKGIEGKDYVECKICGKRSLYIDKRHLKTRHSITKEKYIEYFPNAEITSRRKAKAQSRPGNQANLGRKLSGLWRTNQALSKMGNKNPAWRGGISYENGYCGVWRDTEFKESIKKRDGFNCRLCNIEDDLCIHHIDYDKYNCHPKNLVTLCRSCNSSVNTNRNYWTTYFNEMAPLA